MGIEIINKDLAYHQTSWAIELDINGKVVEISVNESYNVNFDSIEVDWEFLEDHELTDEELDQLDDWIMDGKYTEC